MFVVGVSNRRITGLVPRSVISLLSLLVLVCLKNLNPNWIRDRLPAPLIGPLDVLGKETP